MLILALDVSLTSTGWCFMDPDRPDELTRVGAIRPKTRGLDRYRDILRDVEGLRELVGTPDLVVFEGFPFFLFGKAKGAEITTSEEISNEMRSGRTPFRIGGKVFKERIVRTDAGNGPGNQVFGLAGITEMIKMKIHFQWVRPFACIPPTSIKLYATGNGRARKPEMIEALFDEFGLQFSTDDEVDAYWIARLACDMISYDELGEELPPHRMKAITSLLRGNDPEGTWDWSALDWFEKPFGRAKVNKRKAKRHGKGNRNRQFSSDEEGSGRGSAGGRKGKAGGFPKQPGRDQHYRI